MNVLNAEIRNLGIEEAPNSFFCVGNTITIEFVENKKLSNPSYKGYELTPASKAMVSGNIIDMIAIIVF